MLRHLMLERCVLARANKVATSIPIHFKLFTWLVFGLPVLGFGQAYTITDLGTLGGSYSEAHGINNSGAVAGDWDPGSSPFTRAFYYQHGTSSDLGTLGGIYAVAYGINDANQVVGEASLAGDLNIRAFIWSNGVMSSLGVLGGSYSSAHGIDKFGQVVGESSINPSSPNTVYAFIYTGGGMTSPAGLQPLGGNYSSANSINSAGVIVGQTSVVPANGVTNIHAFVYTNGLGVMRELGTLGGGYSNARAINDAGIIVGEAEVVIGGVTNLHAFVYTNGVGVMRDLGTFGGSASSASAINSANQVVGYAYDPSSTSEAFLYDGSNMLNLIDYVPASAGWTNLVSADGINDAGQITGSGLLTNGAYHAFLLTPAAPRITLGWPTMLPNGQFQLSVQGMPGLRFAILVSTNLSLASWISLYTNTLSGTSTNYADTAAGGWACRYYRAQWLP